MNGQWQIKPQLNQRSHDDFVYAVLVEALGQSKSVQGYPFNSCDGRCFCELDAVIFHLDGIARDDVDYIMETFPIVKRKDEVRHGEFRTKRVILEIYDDMARSMQTGESYQTRLDPPPADPRVGHGTPKNMHKNPDEKMK